jgi:CrcB protein
MMTGIILVGLGSFIGGILRYALNICVHWMLGGLGFPFGTVAVNVIGCFTIGLLTTLTVAWTTFNSETRLFVFVGVLGGFTTFSAFALETFALARNAQLAAALANIGLQLVLGLLAVWFGSVIGRVTGYWF